MTLATCWTIPVRGRNLSYTTEVFFFTTLQLAAVNFNPTKVTLGGKEINLLGHVAAAGSIGTLVAPTDQSFSKAEVLKHIEHVVGVVGFCYRIIQSFFAYCRTSE
jgi:hypothetical protein